MLDIKEKRRKRGTTRGFRSPGRAALNIFPYLTKEETLHSSYGQRSHPHIRRGRKETVQGNTEKRGLRLHFFRGGERLPGLSVEKEERWL